MHRGCCVKLVDLLCFLFALRMIKPQPSQAGATTYLGEWLFWIRPWNRHHPLSGCRNNVQRRRLAPVVTMRPTLERYVLPVR